MIECFGDVGKLSKRDATNGLGVPCGNKARPGRLLGWFASSTIPARRDVLRSQLVTNRTTQGAKKHAEEGREEADRADTPKGLRY